MRPAQQAAEVGLPTMSVAQTLIRTRQIPPNTPPATGAC